MRTTMHDNGKNNSHNNKMPLWVILLWIALWQFLSMIIDSQILLASPASVLEELFYLAQDIEFYQSILLSLLKISVGFILGVVIGTLFAIISSKNIVFKQLISPLILFCKSVPVASFIIVVLIWVSNNNISIFVSFIMVLPIVYTNIFSGINNFDKRLNEMADLFSITRKTRLRYILLPQILPLFQSACLVGLGMSFKAGIAAEVLGVADLSIGGNLYQAKIFIDTPNVFAWTAVILLVSYLFEKGFIKLINTTIKALEGVKLK